MDMNNIILEYKDIKSITIVGTPEHEVHFYINNTLTKKTKK